MSLKDVADEIANDVKKVPHVPHDFLSGLGKEVRKGVESQKTTPMYISREYKWAEKGRKVREFFAKLKFWR
jgi:hypothetical protein